MFVKAWSFPQIISLSILSIVTFGQPTLASIGLSCATKDHKLEISHNNYPGDSDPGFPPKDFVVKYKETELEKGDVRQHKFSDMFFVLEVLYRNALVLSIHSTATGEPFGELGDAYRVDRGFIVLKGKKTDLRGIILYCAAG